MHHFHHIKPVVDGFSTFGDTSVSNHSENVAHSQPAASTSITPALIATNAENASTHQQQSKPTVSVTVPVVIAVAVAENTSPTESLPNRTSAVDKVNDSVSIASSPRGLPSHHTTTGTAEDIRSFHSCARLLQLVSTRFQQAIIHLLPVRAKPVVFLF